MKIKSYSLRDIQSWSKDNSQTIKLEEEKLNVIIGRNETGKSVLFKVFRQMCFSNFYGMKGRRSLIRRGCPYGDLIMQMEDNTIIQFRIYPTSQVYVLKRPNGEIQKWTQNTLPEEIRQVLGWYVDTDNKIILNLIDNEQGLAFIDTSQKFNAGVLKFITEDEDIQSVITNFTDWVEELNNKQALASNKVFELRTKYDMLNYTDTDKLKYNISLRENLIKVYKPVQEIIKHLNKINTKDEPLNEVTNYETVERLMKELNTLQQVFSITQSINNLTKPTGSYNNTEKIKEIVKEHKTLQNHLQLLNRVNNLTQPLSETKNYNEVISTIKTINSCKKVVKALALTNNILASINKIKQDLEEVQMKMNEFEVCPLCGGGLDEV